MTKEQQENREKLFAKDELRRTGNPEKIETLDLRTWQAGLNKYFAALDGIHVAHTPNANPYGH